ncbi:MAG: polysaccharide deacetylase family protein, partial [Chloroflexota bacterium]|nr:polysaccharide deacetylase family protein [Chloroflexota bacterium]
RHILRHTRPGAVIILHDGCASRWRTLDVLRRVLPELERRGYQVVTLSELAEREGAQEGVA